MFTINPNFEKAAYDIKIWGHDNSTYEGLKQLLHELYENDKLSLLTGAIRDFLKELDNDTYNTSN